MKNEKLDDFIEMENPSSISCDIYKETKVEVIHEVNANNNKDAPFSDDGVDERTLKCWKMRKNKKMINKIRKRIDRKKIHSRFDILDL
jgi:hypothetical protein